MSADRSVGEILQQVQFELYRDNVEGALDILERALARHGDPALERERARIGSWLWHLGSRERYADAYERYYAGSRSGLTLKRLEVWLRILLGVKTRKTVKRVQRDPEFARLEQEIVRTDARRILDAGCGEGRVALTVAARHPARWVDAVEVSGTNARLAQRMNRFRNLRVHQGILEDSLRLFGSAAFDLVYSFAVLEHVRDVDEAVAAVLDVLRPGGRFCFVVPMNEFKVTGELPPFEYDGHPGHVRVFTEAGLHKRFGGYPEFVLAKIPGELPRRFPATLAPLEFGSFFVALSKPR
jgi:SAM-dependent methyltransferase